MLREPLQSVALYGRRPLSLRTRIVASTIVLALTGLAFFGLSRWTPPNDLRLSSLVATNGMVTSTDIFLASQYRYSSFVPLVNYTYTVNGVEYYGNRVQLQGPYFIQLGEAQKYAENCQRMGSVTVWPDPLSPSDSVLLKTPVVDGPRGAITAVLVAIAFFFLVILWVCTVPRSPDEHLGATTALSRQ